MPNHAPAADPASLMSLFADRAAAGDADGLLALYEPDAVFEPALGTVLRGAAQIRPALLELAALRPTIAYEGDPDVVIVDDIAIVSNTWTLSAQLPDGARHREGGLSADVLRRQSDGRWLILVDQPRGQQVGDAAGA
ncbi:MAG: SgcJ/EcaC family oxidoreductase [Solirubrobacteraceae bacterium]|nr:SgcJ/EcaC family oxidoreductase [Solirubrobacteraceae bacterium]